MDLGILMNFLATFFEVDILDRLTFSLLVSIAQATSVYVLLHSTESMSLIAQNNIQPNTDTHDCGR